jgi:FHS family L-fucose permease-like MFS transporter
MPFARLFPGGLLEGIKRLDVQHGRPKKELRRRDTVVPIAITSVTLFCMWGLAYGLLDIMNYHVKVAMGIGREKAAILAAGYYGAYIPGALLIGGPLVKRCGYRVAMVLGLFGLALGDFFMSIGAQNCSLAGMVAAMFVIGLGVSTLERSANPYAVNCGPRTQATLRILIAQAWAGIGTVIAPFLANAFVFNPDSSSLPPIADPLRPGKCLMPADNEGASCANLGSVIVFYRALGGCIFGLMLAVAVVFFRTTWVPEVDVPASPPVTCGWRKWDHPLFSWKYARIWWGVAANFVNIGCQVTFAQFFLEHMKVNACASDRWAALCMSFAQVAFVLGRFAAAGLVTAPRLFKPRYVLATFVAGAVATAAAGTAVTGTAAISLAVMVMFFEAPSFPMIFESATAAFDEWTPTCETLMIVSISGGALQPPLMAQLVEAVRISTGWWLTAACFVLVWTYPLATNLIPSFRRTLDAAEIVGDDDDDDHNNGDSDRSSRGRPATRRRNSAKLESGGPLVSISTPPFWRAQSQNSSTLEGVEPSFHPPAARPLRGYIHAGPATPGLAY